MSEEAAPPGTPSAEPAAERERWVERVPRLLGGYVPDAITASVILLLLLLAGALALGNSPKTTAEAYYRGLWMLLPFTMQMSLIIVLSSALGKTRFFRKSVTVLSGLPRTANQVVVLSVLVSGLLAYLSWGLGMALSPIVTIFFAREAERKGIRVDFMFLLAVSVAAQASWQFGLSATAPLMMATPGHFLAETTGLLSLRSTIWSPAAVIQEVCYAAAVILVGCVLMPAVRRPISSFPEACRVAEAEARPEAEPENLSERLERGPAASVVSCALLAGWLYFHFVVREQGLDINSLNTFLLFFCFLLHGSVYRFTMALREAIVSAWPVVVVYHLYAGVAGVIQYTTVGETLAGIAALVSNRHTFPLLTALSGAIVSMFVPSSGGQWVIQGYVTSKAAAAVGVSVQRGLLALSVGDHVGNLASPFWYVIVAGIARVSFRGFFGFGLLFALIWFVMGVVVFTFAPC